MKKLFLLVTVLGFFLSGCGAIIGSALSPVKSNYSENDLIKYTKKKKEQRDWEMGSYEICKSGSDDGFNVKHFALCNKTVCGWRGFKNRDWCKKNICRESLPSRDEFCETLDNINNEIKGLGFRFDIERIRIKDSLCNGKKPVHEFVADWEKLHRTACKDGKSDCVEVAFEHCGVSAVGAEWLNRKNIEEQYKEKKAALCNGELLSRPYKAWFEWAICKEYRNIVNQSDNFAYPGDNFAYPGSCSLLSEIYLKAEKESCGR